MSDAVLLYITAGDAEEAARIGRALVEERLVACVNVLGQIRSFYRWQGEVQDDTEVALLAKTRSSLVAQVSERIKALHSYDVPCVVALPIVDGNGAFLDWISSETVSDDQGKA
ncbi:MAG: divalent-cation tolerance protein CutA [Alphaproteobacteria bacterium]|jgi:periplasmic divalent cation tolerance protein|nr:divalent-cation tolerance protein CutA [Rhodospirillaceae bacterium]MDP6404318.1 divalent-cation tolerance protein CutA [Alphaproteobacteria bacterium]MDP6624741.1 divalent-cation tolerance protein CutA [Alphaproteobacteria bacterium]|tara:strand:- start:3038 stop:3376 length:339 start_codon:yes stop_codon:yes gene_type:complete